MIVKLPIGFKKDNGEIVKEAEVKALDGFSRKLMTEKKSMQNPARVNTAILVRNVVNFGGEPLKELDARALFVVDRNAIMIGIQRETQGDKIRGRHVCPWCKAGFEVEEDVSELPARYLGEGEFLEEVEVKLEHGYMDRDKVVHKDVVLRIPTGIDEEVTQKTLDKGYGDWQMVILIRTIKKFGTLDMAVFAGLGVKVLEVLNVKDIDRMTEAITLDLPCIDPRLEISCPECGRTSEQVVDYAGFFAMR